MEFIKEATDDTPLVYFSSSENTFIIQGNSLPEEVSEFYEPVLGALDTYLQSPNEETEFIFKLFYFNSASSKLIFTIIENLNNAFEKGVNVKIKWMYEADDDDILDAGKTMQDHVKIPMEYEAFFEAE